MSRYLTHEWEELQLRKKSDAELQEELFYLLNQTKIRFRQLETSMRMEFAGIEESLVPPWKLIEDIKELYEQFTRIAFEKNRRDIP